MSIAGETAASNLSSKDTFGQADTATSLKKQKNASHAVTRITRSNIFQKQNACHI